MKRFLLALALLAPLGALAATAPATITTVAPVVDAQCSVVASPSNTVTFVAATGRLFWCNPTPRGAPSVTRWQILVINGTGSDGTYGILLDINTAALENPPSNKGTSGWFGSPAKPGYRRSGENTYAAMWTNGGTYGPITCTSGTCALDLNSVGGTHINLTGNVTGDVMRYNGTDWVVFHVGTALQVLRTNSGATDIEWGTSSSGGDNIKINGTDFTGSFANFVGAGESGGDIQVTRCTNAGVPLGNCGAADDIVWNFVAQRIEDGDINNFAAIQWEKMLGVGSAATHGITFWGVKTATNAAFDTGTEVCTGYGLSCLTTFDTPGTPIACGTAHTSYDGWFAQCNGN